MQTRDHPLWAAIQQFPIGGTAQALSFAERLRRENGWNAAFAARVLGEYRRFCFLAVTSGHAVTPSDAVDQAWHLHLTYTRDYWERFCPDALGRTLHHEPTAGGHAEQHRFHQQYAETLRSYEASVGKLPSTDIWPAAARRLIGDPRARRAHPRDGFVVPIRWALRCGAALGAVGLAVLFSMG